MSNIQPLKSFTRENWLNLAVERFRPLFKRRCGIELPSNIKVTVSFALNSRKAIGQAFAQSMSTGGYREILICPTQDSSVMVLAILAHELIHAWDDNKSGHRGPFIQVAKALGFKPKYTEVNLSEALHTDLKSIVNELPPYPHSALSKGARSKKKQSTRMIKLSCVDCGFICRASRKAIDTCGYPVCGCGCPMDES